MTYSCNKKYTKFRLENNEPTSLENNELTTLDNSNSTLKNNILFTRAKTVSQKNKTNDNLRMTQVVYILFAIKLKKELTQKNRVCVI